MTIKKQIEDKITQTLNPTFLEITNESHMHSVPPGSESHFKLTLVSELFEGKNLLARHRLVNEILAHELKEHIHALALHTFTPSEWQARQKQTQDSPPCLGGSKS